MSSDERIFVTAPFAWRVQDVELAADIVIGIWLQVTPGSLERRAPADLTRQALDAAMRALGAS